MDDMQFSKYSCDIREILSKTDREGLETLVRNAVAYAQSNNRSKTNWIIFVSRFVTKIDLTSIIFLINHSLK